MAIEASITVKARALPQAYIRVAKITRVEKDVAVEGVVYVHATEADRIANREPEQQFQLKAPYSDKPYAALYAQLKAGYPGSVDV